MDAMDNMNKSRMLRVIGIDFGTSTTYMYVKRYNLDNLAEDRFNWIPVAFDNGESRGAVNSVIRENSDGTFDFGRIAAEEIDGSVIHSNFKMSIESPDKEEQEKSRLLVRKLFEYLYNSYKLQINQLGGKDDDVQTIVSYPVKWQESTANFMIRTAMEVGFENVIGMDEATAAISTVISLNFDRFSGNQLLPYDRPGYMLLIDMGAGTTDLALCKCTLKGNGMAISADSFDVEIVTTWPLSEDDPTFGGREVDAVLTEYLEDFLSGALSPELRSIASRIVHLGNNVKLWKENNVSPNVNKNKPVTTCGFIRAYLSASATKFKEIDRAGFEALIDEGLRDYCYLIQGCLEQACSVDPQFRAVGLDMVILTGGHSKWYFAKDIVDGTMPGLDHPTLSRIRADKSRAFCLPNPQATVVLGLVYNRLLSSLILTRSEPVDDSWVNYLYNAMPNPEFICGQNIQEERGDIYAAVIDFTANEYRFPQRADFDMHTSVFESNPRCLNTFRQKSFFSDKRSDICFCAEKNTGSPVGFAVCPYGIYYETRLNNGCISWQMFMQLGIAYSGWNGDKISIGSTVIPANRQCAAVYMDYLIGLQNRLNRQFGF